MTLRKDEVFRHDLPGAGGWGDPLARDLALVAKDLRDGLVTIEGAARDYAVIARGDPPMIDEAATFSLRAQRSSLGPTRHEIASSPRDAQ
jgi:N-methylhydantoinase B